MKANARSPSFDAKVQRRFDDAIEVALAVFDHKSQKVAACEEMAELAHLLLRDVNNKKIRKRDLQEEIADCFITLNQMAAIYFDSREEFTTVLSRKLAKLEGKLGTTVKKERR